jgi:Putative beta-barrel porin-2, OmpL-like. bbp2
MRLVKLFLTSGVLVCMLTAMAFAQYPASAGLRQPYNDGYLSFVPGDNAPPAPSADKKTDAAPEEEKKEEAAPEEEKAPEPKRLIGQVGCTKLNITGWLEGGGTINPDYPASRYNGTLAPNDRNEFQFNQLYMVMEKPLNTDCGWDIGGRIDLLYGTDYIFTESLGFETNRDGSPKWNAGIDYGLAMPQVYADIGYGKYDLKIGRFYTILGYESMMAISNFFYSMNYTVRYAEPTTHTGGLLTYKKSDELSLFVGGVNGQDQTDGLVNSFGAITGFAWTPKEKKYALNFGIMTGCLDPTLDINVYAPRTEFSTYLTYNFNKKWQSVSQFDAGWQQNFDLQGHQADYFSFTQYLFYTINDCWKAGLRYDMFVDDQATKLGGLRFGGLPGGNPLPLPSGDAGTVQAITAGLNYGGIGSAAADSRCLTTGPRTANSP